MHRIERIPGGELAQEQTAAPVEAEILRRGPDVATGQLLALQRTAGNHAVGRTLARAPETPSAVAAPGPGELSPEEQAFFNLTVEAGSRVALATGKYSSYLSSITIPYALAWKAHTDTLKSAEMAGKNTDALVLGTILALIPGGIGGAVGKTMKNLGAGDPVVDGVKDLAKYGLREAGRRGAAPGSTPHGGRADPSGATPVDMPQESGDATGSGFSRMPTDPLVWQNQANLRAESEVLTPCRGYIVQWQNALNRHDPSFDMRFDPVAPVDQALKMPDGRSLFDLKDEPSEPTMKGYERGFLADWIATELGPISRQQIFGPSWWKIEDGIESYGLSIGLKDVRLRMYVATRHEPGEEQEEAMREVPAERERLGQPPL